MSGTSPSPDARFITRLESVRGCAAICVAVVHSFIVIAPDPQAYPLQSAGQSLIHIMFQGTSALIVFFLISGYVLGLSLDRSETTLRNIFIFYMRRIFRIYPAHIVWIGIALGLLFLFGAPQAVPTAAPWVNDMNSGPLDLSIIIMNIALVITSIIPAEWTLTLELIVYLIYPFLYMLNRRGGAVVNALLLLALIACSYFLGEIKLFYYLYAFYFGLAAAPVYKRFIERISDRTGTILLWISMFLLLVFPILTNQFKFLTLMVQVVTGSYLIFACIYMKRERPLFRFLDRPAVQRMGQISYSFYICHFLINYWVAHLLFSLVGYGTANEARFLFMATVAAISIPLAHRLACISYDRIEAPTMKYSAGLSRRMRRDYATNGTIIPAAKS